MFGRRVAAVVVVFALALGAVRAEAAADAREVKAREDFAAGRFQEALDIFARLYAETLHPIYLRNIGRCYQNLGKPDRAIATFRDYLRKHTKMSADERKEVEGFIKEMEDMEERQREAAARPAATTAPPPAPVPAAPAETAPQAVLVNTPAARRRPRSRRSTRAGGSGRSSAPRLSARASASRPRPARSRRRRTRPAPRDTHAPPTMTRAALVGVVALSAGLACTEEGRSIVLVDVTAARTSWI